jgi:predicted nucleic acid-binding protein
MWQIYLDTCCLNRPFDDQSQDRIRLEAEAILLILAHMAAGEWHWITSQVVAYEIGETSDVRRRSRVRSLAAAAHQEVPVGDAEVERGEELEALGFPEYDALHIACAEAGSADLLLTTDDRFCRLAARHSDRLHVRIENPLTWLQKALEP